MRGLPLRKVDSPSMSSKKKKISTKEILCHACKKRVLDYPFVHQYCQHVVCAVCSYKQKKELYCLRCRTVSVEYSNTLMQLAPKNNHCQQIYEISSLVYGEVVDASREELRERASASYAEATIQTSSLVSAIGVQPIGSQVPSKPRTCCEKILCCCIWESLYSLFLYVLYFIAVLAIFAWTIWALNWIITGDSDLRKLPFFRDLPYADKTKLNNPIPPSVPNTITTTTPPSSVPILMNISHQAIETGPGRKEET